MVKNLLGEKEYRDSRTSSLKSGFRIPSLSFVYHLTDRCSPRTMYKVLYHVIGETKGSNTSKAPSFLGFTVKWKRKT